MYEIVQKKAKTHFAACEKGERSCIFLYTYRHVLSCPGTKLLGSERLNKP